MYQTYGSNALQGQVIPGFNQGGNNNGQQAGYGQQTGYGQQGNQGSYNIAQINDLLVSAAPRKNVETPTGTYQVKVAKMEMKNSQSTNNPMIYWQLEHISGEYAQAIERLYDVIPVNLDFNYQENVQRLRKKFSLIKGRFQTCGVDTSGVQSIEGFQNLFPAVLDVTLEIRKVVKGENSNIYFNKRIFVNGRQAASGNTNNVVGFPVKSKGNESKDKANNQDGESKNTNSQDADSQSNNSQNTTQLNTNSTANSHQNNGQYNNQGNQAPQENSQANQSTASNQTTTVSQPTTNNQPTNNYPPNRSMQLPTIRETTPPQINYQANQGQVQNGQMQNGQFQQAPAGTMMPPGMNNQMYQGQDQAAPQIPGYNQGQQQMQLPLDISDEGEIVPDEFDSEDMPF